MTAENIPARFVPEVHRQPLTGVLKQIQIRISQATFDSNVTVANQGYKFEIANKWRFVDIIEARKRMGKAELCHRHRHMHYPFRVVGITSEEPPMRTYGSINGRSLRPTYYEQFVQQATEPMDETDDTASITSEAPKSKQIKIL